mmetsp:Transcript_15040/g.43433  ORF Transcript_15040/g.43433 Transcript_15040/m.43433 type:complete len:916 (-) Transcript_15040:127-2874(-)
MGRSGKGKKVAESADVGIVEPGDATGGRAEVPSSPPAALPVLGGGMPSERRRRLAVPFVGAGPPSSSLTPPRSAGAGASSRAASPQPSARSPRPEPTKEGRSPRPATAKDAKVPDQAEERAIAECQAAFVERVRLHLTSHWGGAAAACQAMDTSGDGTASIDEMAARFQACSISAADEEGPFDLRRLFFILEKDQVGRLDYRELLYSQPHEITDRVLARRQRIADGEASAAPKAPRTDAADLFVVERFRKLLRSNFSSLQEAFKALDKDKDGEIDFGDLVTALNERRIDTTDAMGTIDLEVAYSAMDIDGANGLTVHELLGKWPVRRARKGMPSGKERRAPNSAQAAILKEVYLQVDLVERFRAHLQKQFGSAEKCMQALDTNGDGDLSFDELLQSADKYAIKECDVSGRYFDLRRIFYVLDTDGSGSLSIDELMLTPREELLEKILCRSNLTQKAPQPSDNYISKNTLERFRRLLERTWGSLDAAYKALDVNCNNDLSLGEILSGFDRKLVNVTDAQGTIDIRIAYKCLDMDQQGNVTLAEVRGCWPMSRRLAKAALEVWQELGKAVGANRARRRGAFRDAMVRWGRRKADFTVPTDMLPTGKSVSMKKIEAFASQASVDKFELRHACVGLVGMERMAESLQSVRVRQVQLIDLQGNYIGDGGVLKLVPAIEEHCLLTKLVLNLNGICDVGAERLSAFLLKAASLVELHLSDNHIGNQGAKDFAKALTSKKMRPSLRVLNLQRNAIADIGVKILRGAPEKAQVLPKKGFALQLEGNPGNRARMPVVDVGVWGSDIALTPVVRPFHLKPILQRSGSDSGSPMVPARSQGRFDTKKAAFASSEEFGKLWSPSTSLRASLDIARAWGEGDRLTLERLKVPMRSASSTSLTGIGRSRTTSDQMVTRSPAAVGLPIEDF